MKWKNPRMLICTLNGKICDTLPFGCITLTLHKLHQKLAKQNMKTILTVRRISDELNFNVKVTLLS